MMPISLSSSLPCFLFLPFLLLLILNFPRYAHTKQNCPTYPLLGDSPTSSAWGPNCEYCTPLDLPPIQDRLYSGVPSPYFADEKNQKGSTDEKWIPFGIPPPRTVPSILSRSSPALDTQGDSMCHSGVISIPTFTLPLRLDVEFAFQITDASPVGSDPNEPHNVLKVGLSDGKSRARPDTRPGCTDSSELKLHWITPVVIWQRKGTDDDAKRDESRLLLDASAKLTRPLTSKSDLAPFHLLRGRGRPRSVVFAEGTVQSLQQQQSPIPFVDRWHRLTMFVWRNMTSAVFVDGQYLMSVHLGRSEARKWEKYSVSSKAQNTMVVIIGGQSSGIGGKNFVGDVSVSPFEEILCVVQGKTPEAPDPDPADPDPVLPDPEDPEPEPQPEPAPEPEPAPRPKPAPPPVPEPEPEPDTSEDDPPVPGRPHPTPAPPTPSIHWHPRPSSSKTTVSTVIMWIFASLGILFCFCCCVFLCAAAIVAGLVWFGRRLREQEAREEGRLLEENGEEVEEVEEEEEEEQEEIVEEKGEDIVFADSDPPGHVVPEPEPMVRLVEG